MERSGFDLSLTHNIIFYTLQVYRPPPPEISLSVCCEYVENLPTVDAPELFGMDQNADTAFLANQGRALIADLLAAQPRLTAAVGYVIWVATGKIDCEQSLFSSKIRGEERKTSSRTSVSVSVTYERRCAFPFRKRSLPFSRHLENFSTIRNFSVLN